MGKAKKPLPKGGDWKTIKGAKVLVKDGEVVAGAKGKLSNKKKGTITKLDEKATKEPEKATKEPEKATKEPEKAQVLVKKPQETSEKTKVVPVKAKTEKLNKTTEKLKKKGLSYGGEWDGDDAYELYKKWDELATDENPVHYKLKMLEFGDSKETIKKNNGGNFMSVKHDGEMAGIALTLDSKSNKAVEVHYAEVAPDKRKNKGVGTAIIANAVAQSIDLGYDGHVFLRSDIDAIRFYENIGMVYSGVDYKADLAEYEAKKGTRQSADAYQRLSKKMREGAFFFAPKDAKIFYERITGDSVEKALDGVTMEQIIQWESEIDGGFRVGR